LSTADRLGSWKARLGINRHNYKINPGLYCVGDPDDKSPVLVTANYKMTFDGLRKELGGVNTWILVLDTKGINVWCAAGKGTFGTEEIARRIEASGLSRVVSHRTLIVPQLGAPGIAAHEVLKRSGFRVVYGPVRASDIKEFMASNMKATREMRTVKFTLADRLVLTPIELVPVLKPAAIILTVFGVLHIFGVRPLGSIYRLIPYLAAVLIGCVIVPAFLPWIPGRSFALKGWLAGLIWALAVDAYYFWFAASPANWSLLLTYLLILPAITSFLAMNFTGASTYTSLSGVKKEIKSWLPVQKVSAVTGIALMVLSLFIKF
jgi:hypothetical protein